MLILANLAADVLTWHLLRDLGASWLLPLGESGAKIDVNNQLDPSPVRWELK